MIELSNIKKVAIDVLKCINFFGGRAYNELGQLIDKKLHSTNTNATDAVQSIDYRYNIRGWLASVNNAQLSNDLTNDDNTDLFGMNLNYNTPTASGGAAQYNGNISEVLWKGTDGQASSYGYTYDAMNRLTDAKYYNTTDATKNGRFNELIRNTGNGQPGYDLNGNISFLNRSGKSGIDPNGITTYGLMDNLTYSYQNSNQLLKVSKNAGSLTQGFIDGTNSDNDYQYDANGNLMLDKNKGITSITYNYLNLPFQVTKSTADYVQYSYDAKEKKLTQQVYNASNVLKKKTDYLGEFLYENDTLKFINHAEGRIVMTGASPEYQYYIKDHLGNVRVTFTTQNTSKTYSAGFETASQTTEASSFNNYPSGANVNTLAANAHTGTNSEHLYPGQVGVSKSFAVMPGDQLQIQAYATYLNLSTSSSNLTGFATALLSAFNLVSPVVGEAHTASAAINAWGALEAGGYGDAGNDALKVFVNIILFDKNYNFVDVSYKALTSSGALMSASYTVKQPGYAYVYISNEHPKMVDVYFDDVAITFSPTPVVQSTDYYPFGLTFNSYTREKNIPNRFKFQGQEHIDDLGLNWDSFKWRNHQPDIGRFFNVDKLAEKYYYNSPYAFSENKVVAHRELEGLEAESIMKDEIKKVEGVWNNMVSNVKSTVGKIADAVTPSKQEGPTKIEKINAPPVAVKEKQQTQIPPTKGALNLNGGTNPLYNAKDIAKGDPESKTVMTQTGGQKLVENASNPTKLEVDTVWKPGLIREDNTEKNSTIYKQEYKTSNGESGIKILDEKKGAWDWQTK